MDMQKMNGEIRKVTELYKCYHIDIYDNSIIKIHNLFINNIFVEPETDIEYLYFGWFMRYVRANYDEMKRYYLIAIEMGNANAMAELGHYYYRGRNYEETKKYFVMGIEHGSTFAMSFYGTYYEVIEKDFNMMKHYYSMAIESQPIFTSGHDFEWHKLGRASAMYRFGAYYCDTERNFELMEKYLLMSIELGHKLSFDVIEAQYKNNNNWADLIKLCYNTKNWDRFAGALHALFMRPGYQFDKLLVDEEILRIIADIDLSMIDECPIFIKVLNKSLNHSIDILDLHFRYSLEGKGFEEAKSDFLKLFKLF